MPGRRMVLVMKEPVPAAKRPRLEKRKQLTRLRLMKSAYALMADKGHTTVSIQEITSAADVGFGTFYTYFASKEAIHDALVEEVLEASGKVVDAATRQLEDPAQRLSAGIQYTLLQAEADPLWGRFLLSSLLVPSAATKGLGKFFMRDVQQGVAQGRFVLHDAEMSIVAIAGTLYAVLHLGARVAHGAQGTLGESGLAAALGSAPRGPGGEGLPRRTAAQVLRMLGMSPQEATHLAGRPLPPIEAFARFFDGDTD